MTTKAVLYGPRDLRLDHYPCEKAELGSDQLRVRTLVSALSTGTDRGNYEGAQTVPGAPEYPRWVGYSNVGEIVEIGEDINHFRVGERIFTNQPHVSDFVIDGNDVAVKVEEAITSEEAAFTYLYFLGLLSLRRGRFVFGETVVVVGLGVLGLATVELARAFGGRVIAVGNDPTRLSKAIEMGAHCALDYKDSTLNERVKLFTMGKNAELVVLAANPWSAYKCGVDLLGENGRLAILSLPGRGEDALNFNPIDMNWLYKKALHIIGVSLTKQDRDRLEEDLLFILRLINERTINPEKIITHRFLYEDIVCAYEMAYSRDKSMVGTVFQWS